MNVLCIIWGICALIGLFIGFIPCLGSFNWINIPFAIIGIILSVVGFSTDKNPESRNGFIFGLLACSGAVAVGFVRLVIGCGIL